MGTLDDKLKGLGVHTGARHVRPSRRRTVEQVLGGQTQQTPLGEAYLVESRHPRRTPYGHTVLDTPGDMVLVYEWAGLLEFRGAAPVSFAFLDTETTGLAGGAGTLAFMVGVGRFLRDEFQLVQFFLRDPGEEPAMLAALEAFLEPADVLVTFNGKSFDLPVLYNRYILNSWQAVSLPAAHLDLLHLARRLWRDLLPSRALGDLERQILGVVRSAEEVPGWLVPQIYQDYLRTGDAEPLEGVFYHNAMDILSMAALLRHVASLLAQPHTSTQHHTVELVAMGRLCEQVGRAAQAVELYELGLARGLPEDVQRETLQRLSLLLKRSGHLERAVRLWEQAAAGGEVYAYEELAKYYEHRVRDLRQAEYWTRAALALLNEPHVPPYLKGQWLDSLEHRRNRLLRKLGSSQG